MIKFDKKDPLTPAMTIQDQEEADQYLKDYAFDIYVSDKNISKSQSEKIAKDNLGYFAGSYNDETRERVERLFDTKHPILGTLEESKNLTPSQIFNLGLNVAMSNVSQVLNKKEK